MHLVDENRNRVTPDVPIPASGDVQVTFTVSSFKAGEHQVIAEYSGDSIYLPVTPSSFFTSSFPFTVTSPNGEPTVVNFTQSPADGITVGQSVSYKITVQPAQKGGPVPQGSIQLYQNYSAGSWGSPAQLIGGSATIVIPYYEAVTNSVYASYSGDKVYAPKQSASLVTPVRPLTPGVMLSAAAAAVLPSSSTSVTVTVTGTSNPNIPPPSSPFFPSQVQFFDSVNGAPASPLGTPQTLTTGNGYSILFTLPVTLPAGRNVVTARYLGNQDWVATDSNPVTILVSSPDFLFTPPTGSLNISAGSTGTTSFAVNPILGFNGDITFTCTAGLPAGASCSFSPDSVNGASQSVTLSVSTLPPTPQPTASAQSHRFAWGVSQATGLAALLLIGLPSRRRRFRQIASLMVICAVSFLSGCGSSSALKPTLMQLSSSSIKSAAGADVTFTAQLDSLRSDATGTVTFYDGTTALGQAAAITHGTASIHINSLAVGGHSITAKYSGDHHNEPSTAQPITQVITGTTQLQVSATSGGLVHTATIALNLQ
jgi:hypothetical protein